MSIKQQTDKNIKLTNKLINYLVKGKNIPSLPKDVSFVPFSNSDQKLNKENEKLLDALQKEENPVVKAIEPRSNKGDWEITPVNF